MNPNQTLLAKHMSERDLTDSIIETAQRTGWLVDGSYFRDRLVGIAAKQRRFDAFPNKGFPDLLMVNPQRKQMIVAELKDWDGSLETEQTEWMSAFDDVFSETVAFKHTLRAVVWRPEQWHDGTIEAVLRGER